MPNRIQSSTPVAAPADAESFTTPAANETYENVVSDFGSGWMPDMQSIDQQLSTLGGFDLLHVLKRLEGDDRLESMINRMSPDERQHLVNDAVKGGLIARQTPNSKLEARYPLPKSFDKMLGELNALQAREKRGSELSYNWTGYTEDPKDMAARKFATQVSTLKPGDSIELDGKVGAYSKLLSAGAEGKVAVKRDADGGYSVSLAVGAELGAHVHLGHHQPVEGKVEGALGAGARVEYRFARAEDAQKAAELFVGSPVVALEKYGRPSAIELSGKGATDAALHVGGKHFKALKLGGGEEAQVTVRAELDGAKPALMIKAEAKSELKASQRVEKGMLIAEVRGLEAKAQSKIELELRAPLKDPDAFLSAPGDYVKSNGAAMALHAAAKVTLSNETAAGHHSTTTEASFSTDVAGMQRVARQAAGKTDLRELLASLGEGVEVEISEKHAAVEHTGVDFKLDGKAGGFEGGFGYEKRSVTDERVVYRGSATSLLRSP